MRSEGYSSWSVCLSVRLSVYDYSHTTGYEAAYERYQQLQCYKGMKNNVAETTAFERYGQYACSLTPLKFLAIVQTSNSKMLVIY